MKKFLAIVLTLITVDVFAQRETVLLPDSILMKINEQNTIYVKAVFNQTDTLLLNFDTGSTALTLTNDVLKNKVNTSPKLYNTFYNLKVGNTNYITKVYDAELTGHGTDGRFGWDLFKNKVVELNYDQDLMVIHSKLPGHVGDSKKFTKLKMELFEDIFLVESEIEHKGIVNKELFLFDTGYQKTVMLNNDLLMKGKFPTDKMEVLKRTIMYGAQGNEVPVITSSLEKLNIGTYKLKNVPAQVTNTYKPFKNKDVHILGNEVLKRFNTFFDFQNNVVYMKPNHLFREKYADQKKTGI